MENIERDIGKLQEHARHTSDAIDKLSSAVEKMNDKMWSAMKAVIGFLASIFLALIIHIIVSFLLTQPHVD